MRNVILTAFVIGLTGFGSVGLSSDEFEFLSGTPTILMVFNSSVNPTKTLAERIDSCFGPNHSLVVVDAGRIGMYAGAAYFNGELIPFEWLESFDADEIRQKTIDGTYTIRTSNSSVNLENAEVAVLAFMNPLEDTYVADTNDIAAVSKMADEVQFVCDEMVRRGADKVIWSTYHYNYLHRKFAEHEPAVVAEFNKRDHGHIGVDLVTPTNERNIDVHATSGDRQHNTPYGFSLMTHEWLKAICEHDGVEVPEWSTRKIAEDKAVTKTDHDAFRLISPKNGRYAVGDTITLEWEADCGHVYNKIWGGGSLDKVTFAVGLRAYDPHGWMDKEWMEFTDLFPKDTCTGSRGVPAICCPDANSGEISFVVRDDFFKKYSGPEAAIPVYLMVASSGVWREVFSESTVDWDNPENMVLLYQNQVDETLPIYPNIPTRQKREIRRTNPGATLGFRPIQNGTVYTLRGRRVSNAEIVRNGKSRVPGLFVISDGEGKKRDVRLHLTSE